MPQLYRRRRFSGTLAVGPKLLATSGKPDIGCRVQFGLRMTQGRQAPDKGVRPRVLQFVRAGAPGSLGVFVKAECATIPPSCKNTAAPVSKHRQKSARLRAI